MIVSEMGLIGLLQQYFHTCVFLLFQENELSRCVTTTIFSLRVSSSADNLKNGDLETGLILLKERTI
jgi:hypothetical protein